MNMQGIALAADSAVTVGDGMGQKIFPSASKIFTLSKYEPVGAMIYGSASYMDVPWETIIKAYRRNLGVESYRTLSEYADNFLSFLQSEQVLGTVEQQARYVDGSTLTYFERIKKKIVAKVQEAFDLQGEVDEATVAEITSDTVRAYSEVWKDAEVIPSIPEGFADEIRKKYGGRIREIKKAVFQKLPLTSSSSRQLTEIAVSLFLKFPDGAQVPNTSGAVIAGFGEDDFYPVLEAFLFGGKIEGVVKHKREKLVEISYSSQAAILPFAQSEMVFTFMDGVDPTYQNVLDRFVGEFCISYPELLLDNIDGVSDEQKRDLRQRLQDLGTSKFNEFIAASASYRQRNHVNPVMNVVRSLPKDELAGMAESLINLTSFKRRVSMEAETVGGPIDVAVISKGDGFIWIKRKHYFESDLNPQFLANYFKGGQTNGRKSNETKDTQGVSINE